VKTGHPAVTAYDSLPERRAGLDPQPPLFASGLWLARTCPGAECFAIGLELT
jgi:hypothetical protein